MSIILPVYDFGEQRFLPESCNVVYRNTLLEALCPHTEFAIGDCSSLLAETSKEEVAAILDRSFLDYHLVGASGARKHGRLLYAKEQGIITRYFGDSNMHAINYASNLTTELKSLQTIPVKLLVVKDLEWGTGDCHGKASASLCHKLVETINNPFQFRAASSKDLWIAKGTIAYSYDVSRSKYDLVLPESCFKGNKVAPGEYNLDLVLGIVFTSPSVVSEEKREDWRTANLSYSVVQYMPWEVVEKDILPATKKSAMQLNYLSSSPKKLAEYLLSESQLKTVEEDTESTEEEKEFISKLGLVCANDSYSQLISHPWVVDKIGDLLRRRWLRLATAGAIKFNSSMVMPDEDLPDNCCYIPGLADGEEVIVFPYPCRWQYDIKVWKNKVLSHWEQSQGILAVNHKTAMKLGRDFDGRRNCRF